MHHVAWRYPLELCAITSGGSLILLMSIIVLIMGIYILDALPLILEAEGLPAAIFTLILAGRERGKGQTCGVIHPAAASGYKGINEGPRLSIVAQHLTGRETAHVEVAVGPKD